IDQLFRKLSGQVQPKITTDDVKSILVFVPREKIQKSISELVQQAWREQENSKSLYSQAEDLLLEELGLKDFKPEEELSFIVNLSDVKSAHRADAEYFQPKYEKLIKQITKKYQTKQLKELAVVKRGSLIDPRFYNELEGTPYIRGKDFSSGRLEKSGLVYINKNFRLGKEIRVKKGDLVFSSIGSVGASALVTQEFEDSFISNNTGKISLKDKKELLPEYLAVVLRSIIGQSWFEKEASQTAQPKISDSQVRSFYIPILPKPTQQKIADLVQKSHEARKQAKQLLEEAKQKVEKLIEK
ncbi:MAG TPA: restriction endonuclease subunit S, partial [Candidatus Pacearchaeota archaeon]|nr:restriction endonuclease subunit S [Candidatus Pacearchaeota archaeon]